MGRLSGRAIKLGVLVVAVVAVAVAGAIYSSGVSGTAKRLGGGSDTVARCQVRSYTINSSGPITTVTPTVQCSAAGTYVFSATVTSGPSLGLGSATQTLVANTNTAVAITIGPSVSITGSTYNVVFSVRDA
jgi:Flp pilus assembly protein TadG